MNNTMTAHAAEPLNYLDSIINEEEKRCDQYSHQWRNFTISRSGRFKSKNKKRDVVDGKLFDVNATATTTGPASVSSSSSSSSAATSRDDGSRKTMGNAMHFTNDKYTSRYQQPSNNKTFPQQQSQSQQQPQQQQQHSSNARSMRNGVGGRTGAPFKSFYETNL